MQVRGAGKERSLFFTSAPHGGENTTHSCTFVACTARDNWRASSQASFISSKHSKLYFYLWDYLRLGQSFALQSKIKEIVYEH